MINYTPPTQHTSLFYSSEKEYLDIIIPYLKAGLENNEFCLWIPPETLSIEDARRYLRESVEDLDVYFKKEQILIGDYESFYLINGVFSASKVIENFVKLESKVLKSGFKGIRATGDASWALRGDWLNFMLYEREINRIIESHKIRAICSYSLLKLDLKDICNIGTSHQSSLVRQGDNWNRLDLSKFNYT